ncbi:MAG: NADPH2:quinone reductase [Oleiphilaceae bacterium]|jgi:putative PIG3 family NAD(P)H quinone oxidoreductase
MKFIDTPEFGGPEVMTLTEGPHPVIKPNEVLVEVYAAGVNRPDVVQRQGLYPAPKGASAILGLEVSGVITEVGSQVFGWKVGDNICALTNGGGYAEYVAVPQGQLLPIPQGLSMLEAASLPETHFTVWANVFDRAGLKKGERFLVHGGASGIGTAAIQMAKALGAEVFTTVGKADKVKACHGLGADLVINYQEEDFLEVLKTHTEDKGIDVILDMVGGEYIQKNIKLAALEGRIVNIAYLQGPVTKVNFLPVMLKRLTLTGSTLRPQSDSVKAAIAENLKKIVWPFYEGSSPKMKPVIAKAFPLEQVVEAHKLMESNQHIGKIILDLKA